MEYILNLVGTLKLIPINKVIICMVIVLVYTVTCAIIDEKKGYSSKRK